MADPVSPVADPASPAPEGAPGEHVHTLDHVDHYLRVGQESGASDIHLGVNALPIWRRFGSLEPIWLQADRLSAADTQRLALGFLNEEQKALLEQRGDVDFAYATEFGRFRASVVRHRLGLDIVFRIINSQLRTMDELGLPQSLKHLTQYHNGLVLVTGSVGSGNRQRWRRLSPRSTATGTITSSRSRIRLNM
jgi:twitching motility protein PilT